MYPSASSCAWVCIFFSLGSVKSTNRSRRYPTPLALGSVQADVNIEAENDDEFVDTSLPTGKHRFRCEARRRSAADRAKPVIAGASSAVASPPLAASAADVATAITTAALLFAFELEIHCASEWAGAVAAQAAVQVCERCAPS